MKALVVFTLAAVSIVGLKAQDAPPKDRPAPTRAEGDKPRGPKEGDKPTADRGPRKEGGDREWMRGGDMRGPGMFRGGMHGPGGFGNRMMQQRGKFGGRDMGRPGRFGDQGRRGGKGMRGPRDMRPGKAGGPGEGMAAELQLTADQRAKAKEIMEATKPKIEALRKEMAEKMKAVMEDAGKELRPLLSPEQQAVFDELQKLREAKSGFDTAKAALDAATKKEQEAPKAAATPVPEKKSE